MVDGRDVVGSSSWSRCMVKLISLSQPKENRDIVEPAPLIYVPKKSGSRSFHVGTYILEDPVCTAA